MINVYRVLDKTGFSYASALEILYHVFVLSVMYFYNDLWDAKRDLADPNKDPVMAARLIHARPYSIFLYCISLIAIVFASFFLFGSLNYFTIAVLALNMMYSAIFKTIPILDFLVVGVWGWLYCAQTANPLPHKAGFLIAIFVGLSHLFQTSRDFESDQRNNLNTSAVRLKNNWSSIKITLLCAALLVVHRDPLSVLLVLSAIGFSFLRMSFRTEWAVVKALVALVILLQDFGESVWLRFL